MKQIVLVAETGSDINPALAAEYNIKIVPMHVSFDHETMEDGAFPVEKIVDYYEETGKLPKTSGSTPGDFETAFDRIHAEYPDAQLLYLAYSAVTTCSMQSAVLAAEERDYVTILDTKQVSAGQCNVVTDPHAAACGSYFCVIVFTRGIIPGPSRSAAPASDRISYPWPFFTSFL